MAKMILDGYTFERNPYEMTLVEKDKPISYVRTYSSAVVFSWTPLYAGVVLDLRWKAMSKVMYDALRVKHEANATVVFDPKKTDTKTYNVEMLECKGLPHMYLGSAAGYRKKVLLRLIILSEVA